MLSLSLRGYIQDKLLSLRLRQYLKFFDKKDILNVFDTSGFIDFSGNKIGTVETQLEDEEDSVISTRISVDPFTLFSAEPHCCRIRLSSKIDKHSPVSSTGGSYKNKHLSRVSIELVPGYFSSYVIVEKPTEIKVYNSFSSFFDSHPKYLEIFESLFRKTREYEEKKEKESEEFKKEVAEFIGDTPASMLLSSNKFLREYGKQLLIDDNDSVDDI